MRNPRYLPVLACFLIFLLSGCLVPEEFEASMNVKKDGTFVFRYHGILTHVLLRKAFIDGKVDNKNDPDIREIERELQADSRFKKASYIGDGRFQVECEVKGIASEPFHFISSDIDMFSLVPLGDNRFEFRSFQIEEKSVAEIAALRIKVNGKVHVRTDATIVSHNAKSVGLLGGLSWDLTSEKNPGISAVIALPNREEDSDSIPQNEPAEITRRNNCINQLRQIDGAKEQWALEKKKRRETPPVVSEVNEYIKGGGPVCPAGGRYFYNLIDHPPTCSHPGHKL